MTAERGGRSVLTSLIRVVVVVISLACVLPVRGDASRGPTTAATLDALSLGLSRLMTQGESTGDYVLAKAAVKAKHSVDAWRSGNADRLDKPFADLDPMVRELFSGARTLVDEAGEGKRSPGDVALQLTEQADQILNTRPGPARQASILSFSPRIVPPQGAGALTVRVRGINLDEADPVLHLPGGPAERVRNGPHEAQFIVPADALPVHPSKLRVHTLDVTYTNPARGFFARLFKRREPVSRQLSIVTLPSSVATFELTGTRTMEARSEMQFTAEPVQFRGTREHMSKMVGPPPGSRDGKVAWRWDLSKDLRLVQSRGVQGRCETIDLDRSSETGVTVVAWVDGEARSNSKSKRKARGTAGGASGWVDCTLVGTVYRVERTSIPIDRQAVTLTWTREVSLPLPPDAETAELTATTFDGRVVRFAGSDDDKFFEIRRQPTRFVIVPKVPEDVLAAD